MAFDSDLKNLLTSVKRASRTPKSGIERELRKESVRNYVNRGFVDPSNDFSGQPPGSAAR
jgi:hypothetical protein